MARALHWVVRALRDSGFGSEEGVPTLGESLPTCVLWHRGGSVGRRAARPAPRVHVPSAAKSPGDQTGGIQRWPGPVPVLLSSSYKVGAAPGGT